MEEIDLSSNQITDISAIQELTSLKDINFSFNQITNIEPIKELVNLKVIRFYNNKQGLFIKKIRVLK